MEKAGTAPVRAPLIRTGGRKPHRRGRWVALTGTPGTGKTSASTQLPASIEVVEVSALALRLGVGRLQKNGSVVVDLRRFRRAFQTYARAHSRGVIVGHLAHFLPVSYIIVLRCHPRELARRLRQARRSAKDVAANVLSETLDLVLVEALATGLPVREVDTTDLTVPAVAQVVAGLIHRRPAARYGAVNWLADRRVTEELLRGRL